MFVDFTNCLQNSTEGNLASNTSQTPGLSCVILFASRGLEFISVEDVHWPLLFMDIKTFEVINRSYETLFFTKLFATLHLSHLLKMNCLFERINSLQCNELISRCSPLPFNAGFTIDLCCAPLVSTLRICNEAQQVTYLHIRDMASIVSMNDNRIFLV